MSTFYSHCRLLLHSQKMYIVHECRPIHNIFYIAAGLWKKAVILSVEQGVCVLHMYDLFNNDYQQLFIGVVVYERISSMLSRYYFME